MFKLIARSIEIVNIVLHIALFNLGKTEQPPRTYAIIPVSCKSTKKEDGSVVFAVRTERASALMKEAEQYPANVRCYH